MNLPSVKLQRRKKKFTLILPSHLKLQKLQPQCVMSASLRRKRHHICGWSMSRKYVPIDGNVLHQRAQVCTDFRKGSPEMSDTKPFAAGQGCSHKFSNRFGLRNRIITGEAVSGDEGAAVVFPAELKKLTRVCYLCGCRHPLGGAWKVRLPTPRGYRQGD